MEEDVSGDSWRDPNEEGQLNFWQPSDLLKKKKRHSPTPAPPNGYLHWPEEYKNFSVDFCVSKIVTFIIDGNAQACFLKTLWLILMNENSSGLFILVNVRH